ncbi:uncharacterized protein LOC129915358 isoform X1 [Episyrphus balteatus]|uniref:uncharacterized protein LOC129915358 isoform X1 n=1 Tax=Episyrphus balteatus TaxID=286459 RepID=UPI002484E1B7|nr:uncharacterized protein LOC129915358 isoform X1 [Episyrphus balteatus]
MKQSPESKRERKYSFGSTLCILNCQILETWLDSTKQRKLENVCLKIQQLLGLEEPTEEVKVQIKKIANFYCLKVKQKWDKSCRKLDRFMSSNESWLNSNLNIPQALLDCCYQNMPSTSTGWPNKSLYLRDYTSEIDTE